MPGSVAALQDEAERSCLCERREGAGKKAECWKQFDTALQGRKLDEGTVFLFPVRPQSVCWGEPGPDNRCVTKWWDVTDINQDIRLCTQAEADAVMDTFSKSEETDWDKANRESKALALKLVSAKSGDR
jgi:hypothetical protein